jgi:hypothetical protein
MGLIAYTGASLGVEFCRPKSPAHTKALYRCRQLPPPLPPHRHLRGQLFVTAVRTVLPLEVEVLYIVVGSSRL